MKFVVDFEGGKIKTTSKKIKSLLKARRKHMTFTVDLTDTRLFSGLYETIWLNYESLSDEDDIPLEIYEDHHATKEVQKKMTFHSLSLKINI